MFKIAKTCLVCCVMAVTSTAVTAQDDKAIAKAVDARKGYMRIVGYQMGPLAGMAKGKMPYDAAVASTAANNLSLAASMNLSATWVPGSDNGALGDKTRALPKIWESSDEFGQAWMDFADAAKNLAAEAGNGQEALAAAFKEVGKSCGGCHKPFRAAKK